MKLGERIRAIEDNLDKRRDDFRIIPPHQRHVRLVPLPFIRRIQRCDQLLRIHFIQTRNLPTRHRAWKDTIDAALVLTQPIVRQQLRLANLRQPVRVLDHETIHVHDPQRTIRTSARHDRPAPAVFADEEIALLLTCGATEGVTHAFIDDNIVLHEIVKRFAGERIHFASAARKEQFIAIDHAAACGGEMAGVFKRMVAFLRRTQRPHGGVERRDDKLRGVGRGDVRIARERGIRQHIMPERPGVLRPEPMPVVIAIAPELRRAALGFEFHGIGLESEIATAHRNDLARFRDAEFRVIGKPAMMAARRAIDPVVQTPAQTVGAQLLVALAETGKQDFTHVGFAIAIRVFEKQDFRCRSDDHAIAPDQQAGGKIQSLGKERGFLVSAVAIRIFKNAHPATRLALAIHAQRIVRHFHDPHAPRQIPVDRNRIHRLRFVRHTLHGETIWHVDLLDRLLRAERRGGDGI